MGHPIHKVCRHNKPGTWILTRFVNVKQELQNPDDVIVNQEICLTRLIRPGAVCLRSKPDRVPLRPILWMGGLLQQTQKIATAEILMPVSAKLRRRTVF